MVLCDAIIALSLLSVRDVILRCGVIQNDVSVIFFIIF